MPRLRRGTMAICNCTSALLHCAGAAVFALVAQRLIVASGVTVGPGQTLAVPLTAGFAALLFAVHPLRVESVAWVTERRDVLSGLFFLLAIWAYLCDTEAAGAGRRAWYWVSLGCFVLALLSKAIAVMLPVVLLVLDVYPLRRLGSAAGGWWSPAARRCWAEKIPFVLASAIAGGLAFGVASSMASMIKVGLVERLALSLYGLAFYLWKTILPVGLAPFYELRTPVLPLSGPYLVCGGVVGTITGLAILWRRRWPALAAGWVVYVATLLPVSGIFQNGRRLRRAIGGGPRAPRLLPAPAAPVGRDERPLPSGRRAAPRLGEHPRQLGDRADPGGQAQRGYRSLP